MRLSYNWLKELLPGLTQSPSEVAQLLTLHSFETVVAGELRIDPGIRVVKITAIAKHPNADRLQLATITDGTQEQTVVCGAPNIAVGQVVPYSPPGTTVKDEEGNNFVVRQAKIRGVESPGMLNSLRELGLHHKEHGGIWVLPSDLPLGSNLADHLGTDTLLEAEITSNRAHDCLSHLGVARELAALLELEVKEPQLAAIPTEKSEWQVTIENPADSPRYLAAEVTGATIAPSPMWLQVRLLAAGGKPKNNLVDITNYVLFEIGNPTHLFDASRLSEKNITVRRAKTGERIKALDELEYQLTPADLVIANGNRPFDFSTGSESPRAKSRGDQAQGKPVAIAGVMGGFDSGVQENTSNLLLEVANFRAFSIQETSRRLNLRSESSTRFSKGIHPERITLTAQRIIHLLQDITGATVSGVVDMYPEPSQPRVLSLRPEQAAHVAGTDIVSTQVADILQRLRCEVDQSQELWSVTVPFDRLDLEGEHDLVEEVIRVVGLENIPTHDLSDILSAALPGEIVLRERLRDNVVAIGFTETYNYSFEPAAYSEVAGIATEPHRALANPPAPELANLRVSLLPGLFSNLTTNRTVFQKNAGRKESALFEIGNVYKPGRSARVDGVVEETHIAGAVVGAAPTAEVIVQAIADAYAVEPTVLSQTGTIEVLDSAIQKKLKYRLPITVFEFNLSQLVAHADPAGAGAREAVTAPAVQFVPYSKYPSVVRDVSMLVAPDVSVETVQGLIERMGGELVVDVDLFDELEWTKTDQKSLAFHVEYQASDRTLTDTEVDEVHQKIVAALQEELSAEIR